MKSFTSIVLFILSFILAACGGNITVRQLIGESNPACLLAENPAVAYLYFSGASATHITGVITDLEEVDLTRFRVGSCQDNIHVDQIGLAVRFLDELGREADDPLDQTGSITLKDGKKSATFQSLCLRAANGSDEGYEFECKDYDINGTTDQEFQVLYENIGVDLQSKQEVNFFLVGDITRAHRPQAIEIVVWTRALDAEGKEVEVRLLEPNSVVHLGLSAD